MTNAKKLNGTMELVSQVYLKESSQTGCVTVCESFLLNQQIE